MQNMAGRLRQGADTGFKDINGEVIHVGEHLRDSAGETWLVNSYLQAVPDGDGKAIPLKQLRTTLCELWDPELEKIIEEMPTAAEVAEAAKAAPRAFTPADPSPIQTVTEVAEEEEDDDLKPQEVLELLTSQELADELRARGFEVTATKTTVITL